MSIVDAVYPDTIYLEAILTGTSSFYDFSGDLISSIHGEYGFNDTSYTDRVARPGFIEFTLKDINHQYLLGQGSTLTGWQKGIRIQCSVTYLSKKSVFSGYLKDCVLSEPIYGLPTVRVTVSDWMDKASNFPLEKMTVLTDSRIGDGISTLINKMPVKPSLVQYAIGDVLPTIFDATQVNTMPITEFQRLALSEFGYIYLRMLHDGGEMLVVESRSTRSSSLTYAKITEEPTYLLTDPNGFILLQENGIPILLDNSQGIDTVTQAYMKVDVESGNNVLNKIGDKVYPRRVDTSNQILFTLQQPMLLAAGTTKTNVRGQYTDPNGGGTKVNANPSTMVPLVTGTHYRMTQNSDGTGIDLTAALKISYTFGSEAIIFDSIQNTGTMNGYVVTLKAQGKGTYFYEPIEYINTNTGSVANLGVLGLQLDQKYQNQIDTGQGIVDILADRESVERSRIRKMYFNANTNHEQMEAFLDLDIGDLVPLFDSNTGISGDYIINRKEFDIALGGIINYAYEYVEFLPLVDQVWLLETAGFSELSVTTYVGV